MRQILIMNTKIKKPRQDYPGKRVERQTIVTAYFQKLVYSFEQLLETLRYKLIICNFERLIETSEENYCIFKPIFLKIVSKPLITVNYIISKNMQ